MVDRLQSLMPSAVCTTTDYNLPHPLTPSTNCRFLYSTFTGMEPLIRTLRTIHEKHEKLKHTVHTAWRYPLPKWGQYAMGCFYASIPIVGGWYVMQWAISKSVEEIGERGEKLKHKDLQGFGNKTIIEGKEQAIGAGGRFGGVHLAVSDKETQERNMAMLKAMFEREKKKRRKEKKLAREAAEEENEQS